MARLDEFMNLEGFSLFKCSSVLFFSWQCGGRGRVNVVFLLWSKQVTYTNDLRTIIKEPQKQKQKKGNCRLSVLTLSQKPGQKKQTDI